MYQQFFDARSNDLHPFALDAQKRLVNVWDDEHLHQSSKCQSYWSVYFSLATKNVAIDDARISIGNNIITAEAAFSVYFTFPYFLSVAQIVPPSSCVYWPVCNLQQVSVIGHVNTTVVYGIQVNETSKTIDVSVQNSIINLNVSYELGNCINMYRQISLNVLSAAVENQTKIHITAAVNSELERYLETYFPNNSLSNTFFPYPGISLSYSLDQLKFVPNSEITLFLQAKISTTNQTGDETSYIPDPLDAELYPPQYDNNTPLAGFRISSTLWSGLSWAAVTQATVQQNTFTILDTNFTFSVYIDVPIISVPSTNDFAVEIQSLEINVSSSSNAGTEVPILEIVAKNFNATGTIKIASGLNGLSIQFDKMNFTFISASIYHLSYLDEQLVEFLESAIPSAVVPILNRYFLYDPLVFPNLDYLFNGAVLDLFSQEGCCEVPHGFIDISIRNSSLNLTQIPNSIITQNPKFSLNTLNNFPISSLALADIKAVFLWIFSSSDCSLLKSSTASLFFFPLSPVCTAISGPNSGYYLFDGSRASLFCSDSLCNNCTVSTSNINSACQSVSSEQSYKLIQQSIQESDIEFRVDPSDILNSVQFFENYHLGLWMKFPNNVQCQFNVSSSRATPMNVVQIFNAGFVGDCSNIFRVQSSSPNFHVDADNETFSVYAHCSRNFSENLNEKTWIYSDNSNFGYCDYSLCENVAVNFLNDTCYSEGGGSSKILVISKSINLLYVGFSAGAAILISIVCNLLYC